jgi:hypothetical protein
MNHPDHNDVAGRIGEATPADLVAIVGALDRLGAADREGAPAGLEDHILQSSRAALLAPSAPHLADAAQPEIKVRRHWTSRPGLRLAASVAIVAALGATWLAQRHPAGSRGDSTLARDVDSVMLATSLFDNGLGEEIDLLYADTDAAGQHIDRTPDLDNLFPDWGSL